MAIVINGSGTLSGLAVGGLPDGTVDAGTLATDSVTAAKLEASAITGADLPAGSVLQVVSDTHFSSSSHFSTTSSSYVDTELAATITPKSSNSKILILVSLGHQTPANVAPRQRVVRGSTALSGESWTGVEAGNSLWVNTTTQWIDTPSTTNSTVYKVQVKTASGTYYYHHQEFISMITLMEIAV